VTSSLTSLDPFFQASVTQLYAFLYEPTAPASKNGKDGWEIYNVQEEYMRMGVGKRTKAWRFTDINRDFSVSFTLSCRSPVPLTGNSFQFSPTYPSKLVVPTRISDSTLTYAGRYRSKARIPALAYLHWSNYVRFSAFDTTRLYIYLDPA